MRTFADNMEKLEEEIPENGLIAYCIVFFSEHVMLDIVMAEKLKQKG